MEVVEEEVEEEEEEVVVVVEVEVEGGEVVVKIRHLHVVDRIANPEGNIVAGCTLLANKCDCFKLRSKQRKIRVRMKNGGANAGFEYEGREGCGMPDIHGQWVLNTHHELAECWYALSHQQVSEVPDLSSHEHGLLNTTTTAKWREKWECCGGARCMHVRRILCRR